jgi:hypothetical protein
VPLVVCQVVRLHASAPNFTGEATGSWARSHMLVVPE